MTKKKIGLSVVVLTHNDERRIVDCIEQLNFADEIVVVDDNSEDRTIEIAKKYTSSVYIRELQANFSNQRNFALNKVHNEWALFVDSDEYISEKLRDEIYRKLKNTNSNGFYLKRIDYMWGQKILHGEGGDIRLLRLARKNSGKWRGKVHEIWDIKGQTEELSYPLIHTPHQSVKEFIFEIDSYSTLRANELFEKGVKSNIVQIFFYPILKFSLNYIIKQGYKDGIAGFIYAMTMSMHSFLVRAKLYQLGETK